MVRDNGFRKLMNAFNTQRCLNPSISLGAAEGAFEEALNYVRNRTVFRKRSGTIKVARRKCHPAVVRAAYLETPSQVIVPGMKHLITLPGMPL